jgi:hypothetical protein
MPPIVASSILFAVGVRTDRGYVVERLDAPDSDRTARGWSLARRFVGDARFGLANEDREPVVAATDYVVTRTILSRERDHATSGPAH